MLICVNFEIEELIVYDSMVVLHSNTDLECEMREVCKNFASLLVGGVTESIAIALDR